MKKFTFILAASMLMAFAAANTARADHRSYGYNHGHSRYSPSGHHHHHSHGGIYIQRGFGGYIGPHNAYRSFYSPYSPYGIYGSPNYGSGCSPYYNPYGRVNGSFGIYFRF
jgi:hypothetical protein